MGKSNFKPFISFSDVVRPLPSIEKKLRKCFLNRFVIVRRFDSEVYAFGKLIFFKIGIRKNLFVLQNDGEKILIQNIDMIKVV